MFFRPASKEQRKVKLLRQNASGRYAIIIFAGEAFMLCPLTDDAEAFSAFIDSISTKSIGIQGTDIGKALDKAYKLIAKRNSLISLCTSYLTVKIMEVMQLKLRKN